MTAASLAALLEVVPRTILRDVDAMTEAGLPIIVHRGQGGGIELGFNYRTRLTGLAEDEAEALGILLAARLPQIEALGLGAALARGSAKLVESFPDKVRQRAQAAARRHALGFAAPPDDPRVPALAAAIRGRQIVRIHARSTRPQVLHPVRLDCGPQGWSVTCQLTGQTLPVEGLGDINISSATFAPCGEPAPL